MSAHLTTGRPDPGPVDVLLEPGRLRPAFQPIVALPDGGVVGFEALARWPSLPGTTPDRALAAAARAGRLTELDWACRTAALRSAASADGMAGRTLFVNVEPAAAASRPPRAALEAMADTEGRFRVILEFTERALFDNAADILRAVAIARERGYGIALDDVGADLPSLAMLPFVAPDVVKLDMSLIQRTTTAERARTVSAVMAHVERTGASLLAEGIEDPGHVEVAMSLGAVYGQGRFLGPPGPIRRRPAPSATVPFAAWPAPAPATPFDLVRERGIVRLGREDLVLALTRRAEDEAAAEGRRPVVLAAFQAVERFAEPVRERYAAIATGSPFTAVFAAGMPRTPAAGVRGVALDADDPLRDEWTFVAVADHYACAVIARDLGDPGSRSERRFEFAVTHDRETVLTAGRALLQRLGAEGETSFSARRRRRR